MVNTYYVFGIGKDAIVFADPYKAKAFAQSTKTTPTIVKESDRAERG